MLHGLIIVASRKLGDFITSYLEYVKDTEPPKSYHTWIATSMIAGALQRRVFTKWGHATLYPNLYVILVGKSGGARKGTAMKIGKDILKETPIELVAEAITPERLIQKFEETHASFATAAGNLIFQSAMTCFSEELSVFLEQKDIKFLSQLTDFYDSHDDWKYETKNRGDQHIHGICFNLLGATAPDWMSSMFPQEAIGGGFTSRVIFIYEEKKGQTVPEEVFNEWHEERRLELINDLNIIAQISGEYTVSADARQFYNKWYIQQDKLIARGKYPVSDSRFTGYCERRSAHIRKLSMAMAASRTNKTVIELIDMERALNMLETAEKKMAKSFGGMGKSQYSEAVEMVLDYIMVHKVVKRSELMRQFFRDIDSQTLKVVEEVLTHMKVIQICIDPVANETVYKLNMGI